MFLKSKISKIKYGKNFRVIGPVNLYNAKFGDNVFIGPFTEVQKNVIIGDNCKIQSHTFLCEGVSIGNNCFISHGVMFVNDTFSSGKPAGGDKTKWKQTKISENVYIGTNSTILPVSICPHVVIGAGSVVTRNINKPGKYAGNPAKKMRT
jgi:acetyltransferase-like isoleucine patch superfamily enzyme